MNEDTQEAGGIYMFEDSAAVQSYLQGPIVAQLSRLPGITDIQVKQSSILEKLTEITYGPLIGEPGGD